MFYFANNFPVDSSIYSSKSVQLSLIFLQNTHQPPDHYDIIFLDEVIRTTFLIQTSNADAFDDKEQYVTHFIAPETLGTEKVVRERTGYASTQRQIDLNEQRIQNNNQQ